MRKNEVKENINNYNVRLGYQLINIVKRFSSILSITVVQENKGITEDIASS